jgi:predicted transcriptional regulator
MDRSPIEGMTVMDNQILKLLEESGIILSPSIIAYNIERSQGGVSQHLSKLVALGLVNKIERGKYEITDMGTSYLSNDLDIEEIENLD